MMYHGHGMEASWRLVIVAIVPSALLIAVGMVIARVRRKAAGPAAPDAERVVADRFARGEIGAEDYERTLRAGRRQRRS